MTDIITNISKARQLISGSRLLSCYKTVVSYNNEAGMKSEKSAWGTNDPQVDVNIEKNISCGYCLIIIDGIIENDGNGDGNAPVSLKYHFASEISADDWVCIINNFLFRQKEHNDRYPYHELLWFLANNNINEDILHEALLRYDSGTLSLIVSELAHIAKCLSLKKQHQFKKILDKYGRFYRIYCPDMISQAFSLLKSQLQIKFEDHDLFAIIDAILFDEKDEKTRHYRKIEQDSNNELLHFLYWVTHPESSFGNYDILCRLFSYMSPEIQIDIIKRYFHDVRQGRYEFSTEILTQFKDNKYAILSRYRHCISALVNQVDLAVPLLCDCLLTIFNTNGANFQSFNGILDLSIYNADVVNPAVSLDLRKFLPVCDGGAVCNRNFKGFIDYDLLYKIDYKKLENQQLLYELMTHILDSSAKRIYRCNTSGNEVILPDETMILCKKHHCENLVNKGEWQISLKDSDVDVDILNLFLKKAINSEEHDRIISMDQISGDLLRQNFTSLLKKCENDSLYIIPQSFFKDSVKKFLIPEKIRIVPRQDISLFEPYRTLNLSQDKISFLKTNEVNSLLEKSLREIQCKEIVDNRYFEINYDENALTNLLDDYYYQGKLIKPQDDNDTNKWIYKSQKIFLISAYSSKYPMVCAPKKSEVCDKAIMLPYFWCSGKKCFVNALDKQILREESDWSNYTLFHLSEIIGYTKIKKTDAGYEPDDTMRSFVATLNKARQKFIRLKCRKCGHLLFPTKTSGYNVYNRYSCINPQCSEFRKDIYLNFCYKCKTGFIDSRDTKQCPNGWYICPNCLSCCDNAQYEMMRQRFVSNNKLVPSYITQRLKYAHNNNGIYYCPKCGNRLNKKGKNWYCKICNYMYPENPNKILKSLTIKK